MKALVHANETSWNELISENKNIEWQRANDVNAFTRPNDSEVYFNLSENAVEENYNAINKPMFINSVSQTLDDIQAGSNIVRINGWNTFIERSAWEVAGSPLEAHLNFLSLLQKKYIIVPDQAGFISARIISMIINEAFYAKGENISTAQEIDVAMKLGTNYPYGPFEWAKKIGCENIYKLLQTLSRNDSRYLPSPLLKQASSNS